MPARCSDCGQENRDGSKYCLRCGARLGVERSDDLLIGRVLLDRYRVVAVLGEGGMGRVYRAEQQLGTATRSVAIKVLHAIHSKNQTLRQRFNRECEVVVGLTHPNTIQFHDFGELDDGRLFIVMELIEGESLSAAMRAGPMPLARVERIVTQIAGSLGEAHARGVVHRDLKPDNILLTTRGGEADFVKVCDFGIAKHATGATEAPQLTLQGTVIGTPQYMSPEQLSGGDVDAASDLYSLGLLVFEMLTGARPFTASSPAEWAARHTTTDPPPLESFDATRELPDFKRRAVMRALAKLPADRQASARQLADELLGRGDASLEVALSVAPAATPAQPNRSAASDGMPTPTEARSAGAGVGSPSRSGATNMVDVSAPTLHASPVALRKMMDAHRTASAAPAPIRLRVVVGVLSAAIVAGGGIGAALTLSSWSDPGALAAIPDAGIEKAAELDAGIDAGTGGPSEWMRIVHFAKRVDDAANVLGPPDGLYAIIHPRGTLGLELAAGTRIATDGTAGPDFYVLLDDARSGHYRADVAVAPGEHTIVGTELSGSLPLDADQFDIRRIRYIRLKNRSTRDVYVDAVGAYATVQMDPSEADAPSP